jgi:hypothetical protein
VRPVLLRVHLAADAEEADVEQPGRRGEHPAPVQPAGGEVLGDADPGLGQRPAELADPGELLAVALHPPGLVVQVLPPPGVVGADGLQVTVWPRADPHVLPRRRDHQRLDAR